MEAKTRRIGLVLKPSTHKKAIKLANKLEVFSPTGRASLNALVELLIERECENEKID